MESGAGGFDSWLRAHVTERGCLPPISEPVGSLASGHPSTSPTDVVLYLSLLFVCSLSGLIGGARCLFSRLHFWLLWLSVATWPPTARRLLLGLRHQTAPLFVFSLFKHTYQWQLSARRRAEPSPAPRMAPRCPPETSRNGAAALARPPVESPEHRRRRQRKRKKK